MLIAWFLLLFCFQFCSCAETGERPAPYEDAFHYKEKYDLPQMPYSYSALEPFIDEQTMKVHHQGHHAAYTKKLNTVLSAWRESVSATKIKMLKVFVSTGLQLSVNYFQFARVYLQETKNN